MRRLYISAVALLLTTSIYAQNKDTKDADKLFDRLEYVDAAQAYSKLVEKGKADAYVYKQLGDCYYNVFNTKEAVTWYAKAVERPQEAEVYYRYAQMLKAEGNMQESNKQMAQFAKMQPNDARAKAFTNNPNVVQQLQQQSKLYNIKKSDVSSDKADFGAQLTNNNEVYFASARNTARKKNGMDEQPYLDLYKATRNTDGSLSQATEVVELNTKWHDGPAAITSDGSTIYYGSESFNQSEFQKDKTKKLKYGQIYLYKATKGEGDKWTNAKALPINSKEYSVRNPSISKDGKTLYFSSDMPGGMGGEDIWKVSVDGDSYGTPENLGSGVNSEGNESFPYITDDHVLFFASNGKPGFGGYDVFTYNTTTKETKNVGAPVNTEKDDFAFSYNKEKKVGYFSSNREGNDDIFQADPICGVDALVKVMDAETGKLLAGAQVTVTDAKNKSVGTQDTDESGATKYGLACEQSYGVTATRSGYEPGSATMKQSEGGSEVIEVKLTPIKPIITEREVILQPIYFEYDKSNITAQGAEELDKLVQVMHEYPNMVIYAKSHTDSRGSDSYNLRLSDRRAKATVQYIVSKGIAKERISGKGMGETEPKVSCTNCSEEEHAQNRRSEFLIVKK
ncbi:Probable outer membrane protein precursor, OmpA family [Flavobacterium indicum GPTSA100-9 = DSM 17447]|uniref:Probable outer membrane protein, OmpA family n=1 Tax=Flavobacterium indicum (strain DSM 17447 / CIP 109464 / GPTSA100-9) TaxID=1094466 RepID=H8XNE4_FLAIG|nr:OmpA family protein [Flavobacterium indicum]CCG52061.1 Probable outer membrane protein precursor, OmpA family [Flavobacterium indicum GPTSA100-9 = DSM 17447]